ncbi:MAG TPA: BrnT family toxin [Pyrinomonadaceae bacterium]|nr:BrnT family toxin [Pyrinomonadaceae bacterium]
MSFRFEWDPKKAATNLAKHDISFEEAMTVFADPLARIFSDEEHSVDERREIIIGHSTQRQLILVNFTGTTEHVRIFSARKATRGERKDYEENVGK